MLVQVRLITSQLFTVFLYHIQVIQVALEDVSVVQGRLVIKPVLEIVLQVGLVGK